MMRLAMATAILIGIVVMGAPQKAKAQTKSAYQVGREVAVKRGAPNADCYARVFVRHAVVVVDTNYRRGWYAPPTPAFNSDMMRTCGVDRVALLRDYNARRAGAASASRQLETRHVANSTVASRHVVATTERSVVRRVDFRPAPQLAGQSEAYRAGYNLATQRGYANKDCYARWYASKAAPYNDGGGRRQYAIWSRHHNRNDLWQQCRIAG